MPDYSVIEPLCKELSISIAELLDGEENDVVRLYDDKQYLSLHPCACAFHKAFDFFLQSHGGIARGSHG